MQPTLVVPATLDSLGRIRDYVSQAARAAGLGEAETYRLTLAVDEIATNVALYGYPQGAEGEIRLQAERDGDRLRIHMWDQGQAYDPRRHQGPDAEDLSRDLDERAIGGLGIYLALQGVDGFDYRSDGKGNENLFIMNLQAT